jgi:Enolase C-terminal domain-like
LEQVWITQNGGFPGGWTPLAERNGVIPGTPYLPGEIDDSGEKIEAAYVMLNFGSKDPIVGQVRVHGNVGVRYVRTEQRSVGSASAGVAPHNPLGPIAGVAALHFAVSTPNHIIQEEMVGAVPWYEEVVRGPIRMVEGHWQLPEAPGLGLEVDERICDAHPFEQEIMHSQNAVLPDGTIVSW